MTARPVVTVVTPCYNAARFLPDLIESVRAQTLSDWRHVIVNDGSTDGSGVVLEDLTRGDPRFSVIHQSNLGVCSARNAGVRDAVGSRYLLFLDADDCLRPTMLFELADYLDAHPNVGVVYCGLDFIGETGEPMVMRDWTDRYVPSGIWIRRLPSSQPETPFLSLYCQAGGLPTRALIRDSAYWATDGWDEEFGQHYEDTDMFLRLALQADTHYLPRKLAVYRRHPAQSTANLVRPELQEERLYRLWRGRAARDDTIRTLVKEAERFRTGRLRCRIGTGAGVSYLCKGLFGCGTRFLAGAVRAYLAEALIVAREKPRRGPSSHYSI